MKKLLAVLILAALAQPALAMWPFDIKIKTQLAEKIQLCEKLQTEVSLFKAKELNLNSQIGLLNAEKMTLKAQLQAQGAAALGYQASVSQMTQEITAARDAIVGSNNTNDKEIFKWQLELQKYQTQVWRWLFGIVFGLLIVQSSRLWWIQKRTLKKLLEEKQSILVGASKAMTAEQFDAMMKERQSRDEAKAQRALTTQALRAAQGIAQNLFKKREASNAQKSA